MTLACRVLRPGEAEACYAVYYAAVHVGAASDYSEAERAAWAPDDAMLDGFPERLSGASTWVAEENGAILGFLTFRPEGYLDLFFVHPEARGRGAAALLYDRMLADAEARGLARLTVHASHLARRFLARRGWQVIAPEVVERHGVSLTRFEMALDLPPAQDSQRS